MKENSDRDTFHDEIVEVMQETISELITAMACRPKPRCEQLDEDEEGDEGTITFGVIEDEAA